MMGNWMLSSGSMGVTQLRASATGISLPFLYTTLNGKYGKDLTMSLCILGLSPVNSQIFPIFKELIDIAQLMSKKSVSNFCIWKQKERILSDCN